MLSPFDDYPIHPGADPIAHLATPSGLFGGHMQERVGTELGDRPPA